MSNCSAIFLVIGATILIAGIVLIITLMCRYPKLETMTGKINQGQLNIYITSLRDPLSKKRAGAQKRLLKIFGINKYKYNSALHWKKDSTHIQSVYPKLNQNAPRFTKRPGAYGLTASFLQFLNIGYTNKYELITWMEDDVIPAGAESGLGIKDDSTQGIINMINKRYKVNEQVITNFENKFSAAINNLPKKKNDVYFFGHTAYCELSGKKPTNSGADWVKIGRNDFYKAGGPGSSCVIFSKAAIISIFEWVQAAKSLDLPIDMLFMELIKNRVITGWEVNTSITHNQMFYGLFEQLGTYCHHRKNNTIDI